MTLCFVPPATPLHDWRPTPFAGYRILGNCFPSKGESGPSHARYKRSPPVTHTQNFETSWWQDTRMHVFTQSLHQVDGRSQQIPTHLSLPSHPCDIQQGALHREGIFTGTGRGPRAEGAGWHGSGEEGELKMAELVLGPWGAVSGSDGATPFYHPIESLSILRGFL